MNSKLLQLISAIEKIKSGNKFEKYIDFIQFPFYRNIAVNTKINFDFPLTVFIGQNGCGKSSCLHAIYGVPKKYTPYTFWFDTKVDPIVYYNDKKKRHSFWYSFKDEQSISREVIKARIKRGDDPNYWETSRPLAWAGMTKKERDAPIKKNVVYIDFRAELSAFDKYFYFGDVKGLKSKNKQEFIRRKSTNLKKIISGTTNVIKTKAGAANKKLRELNKNELKWISFILGKIYTSGVFVEHSFFRNSGYSVIFNTTHAKYSEAFAGSGEVAAVRLVLKVLDANVFSLILLDEPEVSLHPGAQHRLKIFLLEQIKIKKHQVILATHSPSIVKGLPKEAIKTFYQNPRDGRFLVKENLTTEEAFYHIEFPVDDRKNIIVEDILAQEIIFGILNKMGDATKSLFNVRFNPGGESVIKKEFATVFCREHPSKNFILFDGDQSPDKPHINWKNCTSSELTNDFLKVQIKEQVGVNIKFSVDGGKSGGNLKQELELLKQYLDYFLSNVFYLPCQIPEEIIWNDNKAKNNIKLSMSNSQAADSMIKEINNLSCFKKKFSRLSEVLYGKNNSENIAYTHKLFLQYWLELENKDYFLIIGFINTIKSRN